MSDKKQQSNNRPLVVNKVATSTHKPPRGGACDKQSHTLTGTEGDNSKQPPRREARNQRTHTLDGNGARATTGLVDLKLIYPCLIK